MIVRLYFRAKDEDRIILVTDGMSATGMPDGIYMLGEMEVEVRDGRCTAGGTLAGSVLTLDNGVQNLMKFAGASLKTAVNAASRNPSQLMAIGDDWGILGVGCPANITVLSPSAEVVETYLSGQGILAEDRVSA
jgi:N-acetylglucosamine-6-phosphate deacetylase